MKSFVILLFMLPLMYASDVAAMTFIPVSTSTSSLPGSPVFGVVYPTAKQSAVTCAGNTLATGIRIHTDGTKVTGFSLLCRLMGPIGATDTFHLFETPLVGNTSSGQTLVECDSGKAITGLRVRSGLWIDALTITCGETQIQTSQPLVNFTGDPNFGNGQGTLVTRGAVTAQSAPVGGTGGTAGAFDCGGNHGFVQILQAATEFWLEGLQVRCGQVLTRPMTNLRNAVEDLEPRSVGQKRKLSVRDDDAFQVQVFNIGGSRGQTSTARYVDLVYDTVQVAAIAVAPGCTVLVGGHIRCPFTAAISRGNFLAFDFTMRALMAGPDVPLVAIQTSYDAPDSDTSNNTYGFATLVQ